MGLTIFVESAFTASLFINAVLFVPQAIRLVKSKDSQEVSFITFFGFWLIQLSIVFHGILRNDYLLIMGTSTSLVTCGVVVILICYYRRSEKKKNESN